MTHDGSDGPMGDRLGRSALRVSVAVSPAGAGSLIVGGLAASWALTYVLGGAQAVVPHFYYLPIVFTAVRFGPVAALIVALASGLLAGPLTYLDVASGSAQDPNRWLTRTGFFVVVGLVMASLVRPSLPSIADGIRRSRGERRLRSAIEDGELFLRYQPIVELATGKLHGVEALVRWQHPDHGELPPGRFLPLAESSSVIHDLGAFVLDEACRQAARWQRTHHGSVVVSVNMSARELENPDLIDRVRRSLERSGVDPDLVCIEITESALMSDVDACVRVLTEVRALGVRLAVDDFGTGYSSLSTVHRFPIDVLKIDRSFVSPIGRDQVTTDILWGLIVLARSLSLQTVAEGVETAEQDRAVAELGFHLGQGFHYARPLRAPQIDALLASPPCLAPRTDGPVEAGDRTEVGDPDRRPGHPGGGRARRSLGGGGDLGDLGGYA